MPRPPAHVQIIEVSPRDGLQNEAAPFATDAKVALIERLITAGLRRIEVTSFVHPGRVPQMADAEAVVAGVTAPEGVSLSALVLNRRGLERAMRAGMDEVNFTFCVTDTFNRRNQGVDVSQSLVDLVELHGLARAHGLATNVTMGASFGCPFEGEVAVAHVAALAARIAALEPDEITLADTIGVAVPHDVDERVAAVGAAVGSIPLRCHFHDTRGTGLANAWAAIRGGVDRLDASLGGIGGCPFAPAATGNIATEDLVYMLQRSGVTTDARLPELLESAEWLAARLDRPTTSALSRAGGFPPASPAETR